MTKMINMYNFDESKAKHEMADMVTRHIDAKDRFKLMCDMMHALGIAVGAFVERENEEEFRKNEYAEICNILGGEEALMEMAEFMKTLEMDEDTFVVDWKPFREKYSSADWYR